MKMKREYRQQNWKIFNIAKERQGYCYADSITKKRVLRDLKENLFRYLALGDIDTCQYVSYCKYVRCGGNDHSGRRVL